jgi:hypothetical protein
MEFILKDAQKVIVDGEKTQGIQPYLPLPEFKKMKQKTEENVQ